eukprot:1092892-Rhodomonas_salina.3
MELYKKEERPDLSASGADAQATALATLDVKEMQIDRKVFTVVRYDQHADDFVEETEVELPRPEFRDAAKLFYCILV